MKSITIECILTYDTPNCDGDRQDFVDVIIPVNKNEKCVKEYLNKELFPLFPALLKDTERAACDLLKISTCADWKNYEIYTNNSTDVLRNGNWSFGNWSGCNVEWSA